MQRTIIYVHEWIKTQTEFNILNPHNVRSHRSVVICGMRLS